MSVGTCTLTEYVPPEAEVLGYGVSLILLNIGMYIAVPFGIGTFVFKIRNKK